MAQDFERAVPSDSDTNDVSIGTTAKNVSQSRSAAAVAIITSTFI